MEQDVIAGTVIEDKYSLERKIGEGGMGAVYLGTQLMVDRPVAIKLLHTGLNSHDRLKQRFEVEAKAIGRLNHPNCITLYDFGFSTELDAFYTVMEYLDGEPMHKRVIRGVSVSEAVTTTRQIAAALDHAHHQGILHRDLKPENIILAKLTDGSELAKVLDFGIARIFRDDSPQAQSEQNRLTRAGEVFGTPAYISPEQARGERELTPASDLYSLGIMLFEMVEGRLPFWGDTAIDTIMLHIQAPVPPITRLDVPPKLKEIIKRLMAKEPSQRYQSGRHLAEDLRSVELQLENSRNQIHTPAPHQQYAPQPTHLDLTPDESREWSEVPATVIAPSRIPMKTSPGQFSPPPRSVHDQGLKTDLDEPAYSQEFAISSMKRYNYTLIAAFLVFFLLVGGVIAGVAIISKNNPSAQDPNPLTQKQDLNASTKTPINTVRPAENTNTPPIKDTPEIKPPDEQAPPVEPVKPKDEPKPLTAEELNIKKAAPESTKPPKIDSKRNIKKPIKTDETKTKPSKPKDDIPNLNLNTKTNGVTKINL